MVADLTAKLLKVTVGGQVWDGSILSFTPSYDSISENGLVKQTAKLVFHDTTLNPSNISPRRNPGLWKPSQVVIVRLQSTNEKIAEMLILRVPNYPDNEILTVDLGCWLTYATSTQLDEDRSEIELGTALSCSAVITNLLEAAGIPSAKLSISGLPYSLAYPLTKTKSNSFVQQAGKLAWGNNCNFLYADNNGVIQNKQWVQGGSSAGTFLIGRDESVFQEFPEPVQPVEKIRVSGEGKTTIEFPPEGYSESFTTSESAKLYSDTAYGTVALTNTIIRYISDLTIVTETRNTMPQVSIFVGSDSVSSATIKHFLVEEYQDIDNSATLSAGGGGLSNSVIKLTKVTELETGSVNVLTDAEGTSGTAVLKKRITTYTYNSNLDLVEQLTINWLPRINVTGDLDDSLGLVKTGEERITWREERPGYWVKVTQKRVTAKDNPDRRGGLLAATALISQQPTVEANSSPPSGQDFPSTIEEQTLHYTGEADWSFPGGGTAQERVRPYIIEPGISNQQCRLIAKKMVELLESRSESHLLELPVNSLTAWVEPLTVFSINDGNNIWRVACDAPTWVYEDGQAYFGAIGLTVQRTAAPSPVGTPIGDFVSGLLPGDDNPPEPPTLQPPGQISYLIDYQDQILLGYNGDQLVQYETTPSTLPDL